MRIPQADLTSQQTNALEKAAEIWHYRNLKESKELARLGYAADDLGLTMILSFRQEGRN
jgi:hypothetical protein